MKFIRTIALLALSLAAVRCEAAASWFSVANHDWGEGGLSIYYYGYMTPEIGFTATYNAQGNISKLTPNVSYVNCGNSCAYWVRAFAENELTETYFSKKTALLDMCYTDPSSYAIGKGFNVANNQTFYLALIGRDDVGGAGSQYTAWVKLLVSGSTLEVLDDDLSYGTLTVGQNTYMPPPMPPVTPTPEPTSGLLLLVGSAMLLIRHRRS